MTDLSAYTHGTSTPAGGSSSSGNALQGYEDPQVTQARDLARRYALISDAFPQLFQSDPTTVQRLASSTMSDTDMLDGLSGVAGQVQLKSNIDGLKAQDPQSQRDTWAKLTPEVQTQYSQNGYQPPPEEHHSTGYHIPGSGSGIDQFVKGLGDEVGLGAVRDWTYRQLGAAQPIPGSEMPGGGTGLEVGGAAATVTRDLVHGVSTPLGAVAKPILAGIQTVAGTAPRAYRVAEFQRQEQGIKERDQWDWMSREFRHQGYMLDASHVKKDEFGRQLLVERGGAVRLDSVPHHLNGDQLAPILTLDQAKAAGVPDSVVEAVSTKWDQEKAQRDAAYNAQFGPHTSFWDLYGDAKHGNKFFSPDAERAAYQTLDGNSGNLSLAKAIAKNPDPNQALTDLVAAAGPDGSPQNAARRDELKQLMDDPKFMKAVSALRMGTMSVGRSIAEDHGLDPAKGWGKLLSGSTDALVDVTTDPTLYAGKVVEASRVARLAFNGIDDMRTAQGAYAALKGEQIAPEAMDALQASKAVRGIPGVLRDSLAVGRAKMVGRAADSIADAFVRFNAGDTEAIGELMKSMPRVTPALGDYATFNQKLLAERGVGIRDFNDVFDHWASDQGLANVLSGKGVPTWKLAPDLVNGVPKFFLPTQGVIGPGVKGALDHAVDWIQTTGADIAEGGNAKLNLVPAAAAPTASLDEKVAGLIQRHVGNAIAAPGQALRAVTTRIPESTFIDLSSHQGFEDFARMIRSDAIKSFKPLDVQNREIGDFLMGMHDTIPAATLADGERAVSSTMLPAMSDAAKRDMVRNALESDMRAYVAHMGASDRVTDDAIRSMMDQVYNPDQLYATADKDIVDSTTGRRSGMLPEMDASNQIALPDFRALSAVTKKASFSRQMYGVMNRPLVDAGMSMLWKPLIMLRVGFAPRLAGEEVAGTVFKNGLYDTAGQDFASYVARGDVAREVRGARDAAEVQANERMLDDLAGPNGDIYKQSSAEYNRRFLEHRDAAIGDPAMKALINSGLDDLHFLPFQPILKPFSWVMRSVSEHTDAAMQAAIDRGENPGTIRALTASTTHKLDDFANTLSYWATQGLRSAARPLAPAISLENARLMATDPLLQDAYAEHLAGQGTLNVTDEVRGRVNDKITLGRGGLKAQIDIPFMSQRSKYKEVAALDVTAPTQWMRAMNRIHSDTVTGPLVDKILAGSITPEQTRELGTLLSATTRGAAVDGTVPHWADTFSHYQKLFGQLRPTEQLAVRNWLYKMGVTEGPPSAEAAAAHLAEFRNYGADGIALEQQGNVPILSNPTFDVAADGSPKIVAKGDQAGEVSGWVPGQPTGKKVAAPIIGHGTSAPGFNVANDMPEQLAKLASKSKTLRSFLEGFDAVGANGGTGYQHLMVSGTELRVRTAEELHDALAASADARLRAPSGWRHAMGSDRLVRVPDGPYVAGAPAKGYQPIYVPMLPHDTINSLLERMDTAAPDATAKTIAASVLGPEADPQVAQAVERFIEQIDRDHVAAYQYGGPLSTVSAWGTTDSRFAKRVTDSLVGALAPETADGVDAGTNLATIGRADVHTPDANPIANHAYGRSLDFSRPEGSWAVPEGWEGPGVPQMIVAPHQRVSAVPIGYGAGETMHLDENGVVSALGHHVVDGLPLEEALKDWADRIASHVTDTFAPTGTVEHALVEPLRRQTMSEGLVQQIPRARYPQTLVSPVSTLSLDGWFSKGIGNGFDTMGKAAGSMSRKGIFLHNYGEGLKSAAVLGELLRNPQLEQDATRVMASIGELHGAPLDVAEAAWSHVDEGVKAAATKPADVKAALSAVDPVFESLDAEGAATVQRYLNHTDNVNNLKRAVAQDRAVADSLPFIVDHNQRSVFAEDARNLMPFLFAQEQFLKRWGRTLVVAPQTIRKAQLLMNGLSATGIVQKDPQTGAEMIHLPGAEQLSQILMATPVGKWMFGGKVTIPVTTPLSGDVMHTIPGIANPGEATFGPLVTVGAAEVAHHFPEFNGLAKAVSGGYYNPHDNPLASLVPSYIRNGVTAAFGQNSNFYLTTAATEAMKHLYARHDQLMIEANAALHKGNQDGYDKLHLEAQKFAPDVTAPDTVVKRWMDEVKRHARVHLTMQSLFGFLSPVAPKMETNKKLPAELIDLMGSMPSAGDAIHEFLNRHPEATAYTIFDSAKSDGSKAPLLPTQQADDYLNAHQAWMSSYPHGGGWFLPQDPGPFSQQAWNDQVSAGLRHVRSADEWENAYHFAAVAPQYFDVHDQYNAWLQTHSAEADKQSGQDNSQQRATNKAFVAANDARLQRQFPLFWSMLTDPARNLARTSTLNEVRTALADPNLPDGPMNQPLKAVIDTYDNYKKALAQHAFSRTAADEQAKADIKQQFADFAQQHFLSDPRVASFFQSVIVPLEKLPVADSSPVGVGG